MRINRQAGEGDALVGVYYRPPDRAEEADEAFYRQLRAPSQLQALVVVGDFHFPDVCCKDYLARQPQSRRFLQYLDDNFLMQRVEEPTRRGALLDLMLTNKEGLVEGAKGEGCLGFSDHEMVEFRISCGSNRITSRITTLDFSRANFGLFRQLLGEIPWARLLEGKGAQNSWLVFRDCIYRVQNQSIPTHRKSRKGARRPAWLNRELLCKLKWKRRVYRSWKEGLATWGEYKAVARGCREATRKAKASLE